MGTWYLKWHGYTALLLLCMVLFQGHGVEGTGSCSGGNPPNECEESVADLVIIMDASGSVKASGYQKEKDFVVDLLARLNVSPDDVRVGIVDYSTQVTSNSFPLLTPAYDTFAEICPKVQGFSYASKNTRTDRALERAKDYLLDFTRSRPGVPDIVVLLSDGNTNAGGQNEIDMKIVDLKNIPGIKVITVGIGSTNELEMNKIATGTPPLYFPVPDFDSLSSILDEILTEVCMLCIGESCITTTQCKGENVECNEDKGGICLCIEGYLLTQDGQCVDCSSVDFTDFLPKFLCQDISFCEDGFVLVRDKCYALTCGGCDNDYDCLGSNQVCYYSQCVCDSDYYLDNCDTCQLKKPNGSNCESDEECQSGACVCGFCEYDDLSDCCNEVCRFFLADLVFVTDNSGSVGPDDYVAEKTFVQLVLNEFLISPADTQVAYVDYSYQINRAFNLDDFITNFDVSVEIGKVPFISGSTRTDLALDKVTYFLTTDANRADIKNFVLFLTDGMTSVPYDANLPASIASLKSVPDTTIFAIGVGSMVDIDELRQIATSNETVYCVADFNTLYTVIGDILDTICNHPLIDK